MPRVIASPAGPPVLVSRMRRRDVQPCLAAQKADRDSVFAAALVLCRRSPQEMYHVLQEGGGHTMSIPTRCQQRFRFVIVEDNRHRSFSLSFVSLPITWKGWKGWKGFLGT